MKSQPTSKLFFIRNMSAGFLFQIFLVSAVSTILLTRAYLSLTDYPQVGGGTLHIAHVLWGGLLMLAASLISFASLGWRSTMLTAGLSGIGFGLFIDEVGKFLTKDNDYFFRPASVIIYLLFLLLVLLFQRLARSQTYTSAERSVNAMRLLEQMFGRDLQAEEKHQVVRLLGAADQSDPQIKALQALVSAIPDQRLASKTTISLKMGLIRDTLQRQSNRPAIRHIVTMALVVLALSSAFLSARSVLEQPSMSTWVAAMGTVILLALIAIGSIKWKRGFQTVAVWYSRALIFDFLVVEPFLFYSEQFIAAYGLIFKLLLWFYFTYQTKANRS